MSDFPLLLAGELAVTRRTVIRWCGEKKIPGAYRTKGGHWRLRKPRRIAAGCNSTIASSVWRYTSEMGYTRPIEEQEEKLLNRFIKWVSHLNPNPNPSLVSAEAAAKIIQTLRWGGMLLDRQIEEEMNDLTALDEFNDALEFSMVANEVCRDDMRDFASLKSLKEREPEKFRWLIKTPILNQIHPLAWEAIATGERRLQVKAAKLRLIRIKVSPATLAGELGISVATLYRRYGRKAVKAACFQAPIGPDGSPTTRTEARKRKTIAYEIA